MNNIRSDLKIIVVGNANTGKTSFVNRWTKNQFHENYKATIVSEFGYKIFNYKGNVYRIQVWDLAGQDRNTTMTKVFCKDSHGVIILSDVTNKSSLEATINWKKTIDDSVLFFDNTPLPMMLVQNKSDLIDPSEKNEIELDDFSKKNGFLCSYYTSVKEGININESMNDFLERVIKKTEGLNNKKLEDRKSMVLTNPNKNQRVINGEVKETENKKNSKCCN